MAAVRERRSPVRPWFAWPLAGQAAFVTVLVLVVGGGGWWLSTAAAAAGWGMPEWATGAAARMADAAGSVVATSEALRIFVGAFVSQPIVWCLAAFVLVMTAACATFGAMLGRVANFRILGAD